MPETAARLLVMIPALNEEDSVQSVVSDAIEVLRADVVVIDDGSTDRTGEAASTAGATVLTLPYNLGVGGAIRTGLRYAVSHGYQRVLQMDGDGQHRAEEAIAMLTVMDRGDIDMVVGSRFAAGYEVSSGRRLVMRVLASVISKRLDTEITDTTSGFRLMGPRAVLTFSRQYPLDYLSDTVEALLIARDANLTVREVGVRMQVRQGGQPSASRSKSIYHLVRLFLIVILHTIRRKPAGGYADPLVPGT